MELVMENVKYKKIKECVLNENIEKLDKMPDAIFWKDTECRYRGGNKLFSGLQDQSSLASYEGLTDYDLNWLPGHCDADYFQLLDRAAMRDKPVLNSLEVFSTDKQENLAFCTSKFPIIKDKRILGVFCVAVPLAVNFLKHSILMPALTCREKEVLDVYLSGYTAKEAARKLKMSYRTVEQHIAKIKLKTNLRSRHELYECYRAPYALFLSNQGV